MEFICSFSVKKMISGGPAVAKHQGGGHAVKHQDGTRVYSYPYKHPLVKCQEGTRVYGRTYKHPAEILGRRGREDVADVSRAQHLEVQVLVDAQACGVGKSRR